MLDYTPISKSILYGLPRDTVIKWDEMGGKAEEFLSMSENDNYSYALRMAIQSCVRMPDGLAYQDLLVTDWSALVSQIFGMTFSPILNVNGKCKFGHMNEYSINLGDLKKTPPEDIIKKLKYKTINITDEHVIEEQDYDLYKEPFVLNPLPKSGDVISMNMLRIRHMEKAEQWIQEQADHKRAVSKKQERDFYLSQQIVAVNGKVLSPLDLRVWIQNLKMKDKLFINQSMSSRETGLITDHEVACPTCNSFLKVAVPITSVDVLEKESSVF